MTEETIFVGALKQPDPAARQAFLDEACGDDDALRRRVEALLGSHEGGDPFLQKPVVEQLGVGIPEEFTCGPNAAEAADPFPAGTGADPGVTTQSEEAGAEHGAMLQLLEPSRRPGSLGCLKQYEILEILGKGGFGTVLKAFDDRLHRVVAVKVLAAELAANATARQRFVREARAAAAVRHDNVISIYAVEHEPLPYLVMEYIDGPTLQQKLDRIGQLPVREILRIGVQIALGLAAAHKLGLVHRDIKPSNILLENGVERVKITDFGLARTVDDATLTQSGLVAGTPQFMSPEQAEGKHLDQRSDLFSLGSVLYTLCAGHPPFRAGSSIAILKRVCEDTPRAVCELNNEVPACLAHDITRLHAKEPKARFQSAAEVGERLAKYLSDLQARGQVTAIVAPHAVEDRGSRIENREALDAAYGSHNASQTSDTRSSILNSRSALRLLALGLLLALVAAGVYLHVVRPWEQAGSEGRPVQKEASGLPNPLDKFQHGDIPPELLALAGGGDPDQAPADLVALLGDSRGQQPAVEALAFSPEGQTLASAGADHIVRVWDLAAPLTGERKPTVRILKGHTGDVWALAFSPDGKLLASCSFDATIMLWNPSTGKEIRTLTGHTAGPTNLAFSPDGQTIAAGSDDGKIRFWDVATGKPKESLHVHGNSGVRAVAYSPDGKCLASAGLDHTIHLSDPSNGRRLLTLKGATSGYVSVAYSADGKWLAAGSTKPDDTLRLWDTATKKERAMKGAGPLHSLAFQPNGTLIATGSSNGILQIWQPTEQGFQTRTIGPGTFGKCLYNLAFTSDGRYLAAACDNGLIAILKAPEPPPSHSPGPVRNVPDPVELAQRPSAADKLKLEDFFPPMVIKAGGDPEKASAELVAILGKGPFLHKEHGGNTAIESVAYSSDGKFLASTNARFDPQAASFTGWEVKLWDAGTGKALREFQGHADTVYTVAFSSDNQRLVTGCRDGTVKVWEVATAKELLNLKGQIAKVRSVACSPDGKLIASSSSGTDSKVIVWDAADGKIKYTFDKQAAGVLCVDFSPDSSLLATVGELGDDSVRLWDTATGKEIARFNTNPGGSRAAVFSHDNKQLALVGQNNVGQVWDIATQQLAFELKGHTNWIIDVARSKDGAHFATASVDGTVRLWDAATGRPIRSYPGHPGGVYGVAFHPDGKTLAAGDGQGQVHIWDVATGAKLFPQHHTGQVLSVAVSADGKLLASGGNDATVRLWDLAAGRMRHLLIGHQGLVATVAISPDNQIVASAGADRTVRLWDAVSGKELQALSGHSDAIRQVAFAPDSKTVASASLDGAVKLWDVKTGKLLTTFRGAGMCWCVAFSPDGKTLAAGDNDLIRLWDIATGWSVAALPGHTAAVRSVAFHPDGQTLASTADAVDPMVRLWDLATLQEKQALTGHTGVVLTSVWRADGGVLTSCGGTDGTVRFWDLNANLPRGKELALFPPGTQFLHSLALTPEGRYLATANPDGTIFVLKWTD